MRELRELRSKRVLLTGASTGIGAALARALCQEGARLALLARRRDKLEEVAASVRERGCDALVLPADVTKPGGVEAAVATLREAWGGGPDVVIANAGVGTDTHVERLDPDAIARVMDVNYNGVVRTVAATLPHMLEQGEGLVVAVGSPAGMRGLPRSAAYSASKAALTRFMESVRVDVKRKGVGVILVHPGFVRTPLTAKNRFKMPFLLEADEAADHIVRAIRRGRTEVVFPWQMSVLMSAVRVMPNALFDAVMRRAR